MASPEGFSRERIPVNSLQSDYPAFPSLADTVAAKKHEKTVVTAKREFE